MKLAANTWESAYKQVESLWGLKPDSLLASYASLMPEGSVLDIGAGEGRNALFFAQKGYDVLGVDLSATAIEHCIERAKEAKLNFTGKVGNLAEFDVEAERYALIIAAMVMQFLKPSESQTVFQRLIKGLRPKGLIYITTFSLEDPGYQRFKEQHAPEVEENTFYSQKLGGHIHYFQKDELLGQFSALETIYFSQSYSLDLGHGNSGPHYHGILTYLGQKG
jgi:SAM-dependent methyltransferase